MLFYYFSVITANQIWYNTKPSTQIPIQQKKSALLEVYKTPKWSILRIRESPFLRLGYDMHRIKCFCFYLCKLFLRLRSQRMVLKSLHEIEMRSGEQTNFIFFINIKRRFLRYSYLTNQYTLLHRTMSTKLNIFFLLPRLKGSQEFSVYIYCLKIYCPMLLILLIKVFSIFILQFLQETFM